MSGWLPVASEMTSTPLGSGLRRAGAQASYPRIRRLSAAAAAWTVLVGNTVAIVWLWVHGGNLDVRTAGDAFTSIARITGLLAAYSALLQVLLLARIPWIERLKGFDRLSVWHRWNGHACLYLLFAHVVFSVWGYALLDKYSIPKEISTMLGGGIYPGMITATVGTGLLIAVVISSVVIVRRRLRYETWYLVHLGAYAGIALGWFHQIPTGNELVLDTVAADYWRSLYVATLALLVFFRLLAPVVNAVRFRLRVAEVVAEGPGVVSLRIVGRRLERLNAQPGQFFLWRFLDHRRWWASHPFSLSCAPDGRSLRITVKDLGDFSRGLGEIAPGTRVLAEGPFGVFTEAARRREKVVLIAGGIGITPVRALLEQMRGDLVVLYRAVREDEFVFHNELTALAARCGAIVHLVPGDHATAKGSHLLSPAHLHELVPDIAERDVYVCGPPAMAAVIERNVRHTGVPRRNVHVERFAL
jgi:predicted ferric reductase